MVSPSLANVLAARRGWFNQRVVEARHRQPQLDTAAFGAFVAETLDELCAAVDAVDARANAEVVEAAFDAGLNLVGQGLAGPAARRPWVDRAWQRLARPAAALIVRSPIDTLGTLTNAVVRMGDVPGVRVDQWIDAMAALAERCQSLEALRALGALCAWRAGMAHLREAALELAAQLDPSLAAAAMGAPHTPWPRLREQLSADRWWQPASGGVDHQGWTVGGFSGLDGPFAVPPEVRAAADHFVVESAGRYFLVVADAFGAVVLPASPAEFAQAGSTAAPTIALTPRGASVHGREIIFGVPGDRLRAVSGAHGAALFSPWSHHIRVVPVRA